MTAAPARPDPVETPPPDLRRLARRCEALIWLATVTVLAGPVLVWLAPFWLPRLFFGLYGLGADPAPAALTTQLAGAAIALVPASVLAWGLLGMVPLFRSFGRGALFGPITALAVGRLGRALLVMALLDPLTRLAARLLASGGLLPSLAGISLGIGTRALVFLVLGATLVALAAVLREAARLADENASFV